MKAFGTLHPLLGSLIERDREIKRRGGRLPVGREGSGEGAA